MSKEKLDELWKATKLAELIEAKKDEEKKCNAILWVLAIIGFIAAVAAIAYAVYCFLTPDYLEDFDDDFDEDFDDDFFEDTLEEEEVPVSEPTAE